jgi:hypothetical protein
MAVTYSRYYRFLTASLPKRFRNGRFNFETAVGGFRSETATWIQKWLKKSAGSSRKLQIPGIIVFKGGDDGRGYRNMFKVPPIRSPRAQLGGKNETRRTVRIII